MNLELNVVKFNNEDVIATSGPTLYDIEFVSHRNAIGKSHHYHALVNNIAISEDATFIKDSTKLVASSTDVCNSQRESEKGLSGKPVIKAAGSSYDFQNAEALNGKYTLDETLGYVYYGE